MLYNIKYSILKVGDFLDLYIYTDESIKKGKYYSNFYGGALVTNKYFDEVNKLIKNKKKELNFLSEVKWTKVSKHYLEKYIKLVDLIFDLLKDNKIKIRIMFSQNCYVPVNLTSSQKNEEFFKLYYQFVKHSFALQDCGITSEPINLKFYFDKIPDTKAKRKEFKKFIYNLQYLPIFSKVDININEEDITEVDSHNHNILQCMDIILGSMQFRLNDKHLNKLDGSYYRGKKTIAKEKLYKHINKRIQELYDFQFNIGLSTGKKHYKSRLEFPYRHWNFIPSNYEYDETKTKGN